jgi:sugar phosphate isomerase/epimerase
VTDRVLLSAGQHNIDQCVDLALDFNLGIEVMAFAFPDVLDGDWQSTLAAYKNVLRPINGLITLHGPFMDMAPGSPDPKIKQITVERYEHAIRVASELGAEVIIFHANFIAAIHNVEYRIGWHKRNLDFWGRMAAYAERCGVTIAMENMWEFDPYIITDVLKEVNHPYLRACLDVGHAHLFSDEEFPFDLWLKTFQPWLVHTHMNNNNGKIDVHHGLHDGVLNYYLLLDQIRSLPNPPTMTLEMDRVSDMRASLYFLQLAQPTDHLHKLAYETPSPDL